MLRLAVPKRHAATEQREPRRARRTRPAFDPAAAEAAWADHQPSAAYLRHLADGGSPRAVWGAAPGTDWPLLLAHAAAATRASGRGVLVCVPDGKDVARVSAALTDVLGEGQHVALTAEVGPARRYREFLAVSRGSCRVVVGTRAAAFAPVRDLGLVAIWDDGDDLHAEPRAPYPHAREVLLMRADREGTAVLVGGFARSVEGQLLLDGGEAHELAAPRAAAARAGADQRRRRRRPGAGPRPARPGRAAADRGAHADPRGARVRAGAGADTARRVRRRAGLRALPHPGAVPGLHRAARAVPRRRGRPTCRWCGALDAGVGVRRVRAPWPPGTGRRRGADGRGARPVAAGHPGADLGGRQGARPRSTTSPRSWWPLLARSRWLRGGYAAVVLLDTWLMLGLAHLRAEEEALRRWCNAVGLVRPGGAAIAVGDPAQPALQALVRWDPAGFATRELEQRRLAHLPPASRLATITGDPGAVDDALTLLRAPEAAEVLGPVPVGRAPSREPGRGPGAPRPGTGPVGRPRRAAAAPLGPQARPGARPGRPGRALTPSLDSPT